MGAPRSRNTLEALSIALRTAAQHWTLPKAGACRMHGCRCCLLAARATLEMARSVAGIPPAAGAPGTHNLPARGVHAQRCVDKSSQSRRGAVELDGSEAIRGRLTPSSTSTRVTACHEGAPRSGGPRATCKVKDGVRRRRTASLPSTSTSWVNDQVQFHVDDHDDEARGAPDKSNACYASRVACRDAVNGEELSRWRGVEVDVPGAPLR